MSRRLKPCLGDTELLRRDRVHPPLLCHLSAGFIFASLDPRLFLTLIFQKCWSSQNSLEKFLLCLDELLSVILSLEPVKSLFPCLSSSQPAQLPVSGAVQDTFLTWHVSVALLLNIPGIPKGNTLLRTAGFPMANGTYKGK